MDQASQVDIQSGMIDYKRQRVIDHLLLQTFFTGGNGKRFFISHHWRLVGGGRITDGCKAKTEDRRRELFYDRAVICSTQAAHRCLQQSMPTVSPVVAALV